MDVYDMIYIRICVARLFNLLNLINYIFQRWYGC